MDEPPSSPPSFSVVVCTRNKADTLVLALQSLGRQTYPMDRYEVIVVDDGSSDATPHVARRIADEFSSSGPRFRYVRREYAGLSAARNAAIEMSKAPIVVFVDDDVEVPPGWLTAFEAGAARHPEAGILGGRIVLRLEGKPPRTCGREPMGGSLDLGPEEQVVGRVKGGNMALRRSAIEKIGGFNELLTWRGDEEEWQIRLLGSGGTIVYLPDAWLWHRRTAKDLRLLSLLKARFGWGYGHALYCRESGRELDLRRELRGIPLALAHGVRRRCLGGVLQATVRIGILWAALRGELRKTTPPSRGLQPH